MRIYLLHVSVCLSYLIWSYAPSKVCNHHRPSDTLKREEIERDSAKDQAVVFIFIFTTVGLLGYAIVRPWVSRWVDVGYLSPAPLFRGYVTHL